MSVAALRAGVIGWPVAHSRSPLLHGYWLRKYGIEGSYEHLPTPPEEFAGRVRWLIESGWRGANVTIPHKVAMFALADETTERARRLGAVNTITFDGDRGILPDNTDGFGFLDSLIDWRNFNVHPSERPSLVIMAFRHHRLKTRKFVYSVKINFLDVRRGLEHSLFKVKIASCVKRVSAKEFFEQNE